MVVVTRQRTRGVWDYQSYILGWVFAALQFPLWLALAYNTAPADVLTYAVIIFYDLPWAILSTVAAATRRPWGWYWLTYVGLPLNVALGLLGLFLFVVGVISGPSDFKEMLRPVVLLCWFVYFYRRREMFGAQRPVRWLERLFPSLPGEVETG